MHDTLANRGRINYDQYSNEQLRRHEVKPGISGWAQINGRNSLSWEDRFKLDIWYVDNRSFYIDLKIFFITIIKVFTKSNINSSNGGIMPAYKNKNK